MKSEFISIVWQDKGNSHFLVYLHRDCWFKLLWLTAVSQKMWIFSTKNPQHFLNWNAGLLQRMSTYSKYNMWLLFLLHKTLHQWGVAWRRHPWTGYFKGSFHHICIVGSDVLHHSIAYIFYRILIVQICFPIEHRDTMIIKAGIGTYASFTKFCWKMKSASINIWMGFASQCSYSC